MIGSNRFSRSSHGSSVDDMGAFQVNGAELCVETFGDPSDPAILLIMGAAASMLWWEEDLCSRIAAGDRFVIRFDNRDTGRSTTYPPGRPEYSFGDLARDAVGILDALGIDRAHVVAQSMFGGVALILGVDHRDRVASLTFVSTSTGADDLPPPTGDFDLPAPDFADRASVVEYVVQSAEREAGGSPYFDDQATRRLVEQDVARARNPESTMTNHFLAKVDGPAGGGFGDITAPTLVVHGDLDPLLPLAHGEALRDAIPGAELLILEGCGHGVPRGLWDLFVPALIRHTSQA